MILEISHVETPVMWVKQPRPCGHHPPVTNILIKVLRLPFPVMGGKNGIVLPTWNHIILYNLSLRFLLLTHQVGLELKPWILFGETPKVQRIPWYMPYIPKVTKKCWLVLLFDLKWSCIATWYWVRFWHRAVIRHVRKVRRGSEKIFFTKETSILRRLRTSEAPKNKDPPNIWRFFKWIPKSPWVVYGCITSITKKVKIIKWSNDWDDLGLPLF